jgi:surfactin synthase thioesterase subunit
VPCIYSSPGEGDPSSPPPIIARRARARTTICSPFWTNLGARRQQSCSVRSSLPRLLPALRADLALVEAYAIDPGDHIACPISAFGGADDLERSGSLQSWRSLTRGKFRTCVFSGGHFYFSVAPAALAREIIQDLLAFAPTSHARRAI